jgi:hypothetical protein
MRIANFAVFQTEDSVPAVRKAFAGGTFFSGITFDSDISAPSEGVVSVARSLTAVPLVLFANASIYCDESAFDLVIPALSHPNRWLKQLNDAIETTRAERERSRKLRQDCAAILSTLPTLPTLRTTLAESARLSRVNPNDLETFWRVGNDPSTAIARQHRFPTLPESDNEPSSVQLT